ncbi:MAG: GAF domain-containing protein [Candidatus Rokubacteria bacterium]|nr:GAF domain-containing protein [Candidatus Rokubacteria bacterium]
MAPDPDEHSDRVRIGLVGAGKGGSALLDLLLDWPVAKVAVVIDPRPDAPALGRARFLRIPTAAHHLEVFAYPVDLVLEVTGRPAVLEDLLRAKPPGIEVIGAGSLRFFWDLLQDRVKATRQLAAQLDMAMVLGSTLDLTQQIALVTRKLAQACGVDRCAFYLWDEGAELVTPVMSQFATGEANERMWAAFKNQAKLKLAEVPFLYEVMERRGPIEIEDPASSPLVPHGWGDFFEMKSLLVVPIFRKDRVAGACLLDYCRESRRFTPDQTALAIALSGQIALALENAQLYADVMEKASRLASLLESTKRTAMIKDSSQLLPWIAREAAIFLKAEGAGIRILEGEELVLAAHHGFPAEQMRERIALGESGSGWVVLTNQPLTISDLQRDARLSHQHRAVYHEHGLRSFLAVPMRIAGRAIGALFVLAKDPRHFSATDIEVLSGFADQAALALENARLFEEAERRRREAEVLSDIARSLNASLDLGTVLQRVTEGARELCGSDMARIALWDQGADALVFRHWVGSRYMGYDTIRIKAGKGLGGQVMLTGRPLRTDNYAEDPRISKDYLHVADEEGFVPELAVPIRIGDRVEGLVFVDNRTPRPFTDHDEAILVRLADHAAIAIQNARLYEETERRRRAAESLADLGRLVSRSLDPEETAQEVVNSLRALFGAKLTAFYRLDEASGALIGLAAASDAGHTFDWNRFVPQGTGAIGLAVRERQAVVTPDLLTDPRVVLTPEMRSRAERAAFHAVLAIPLAVKDKVIGALAVGDRAGRVFSDEEVRLAQAFADQAALALENARLYQESEVGRNRLATLVDVAQRLTRGLDLPVVLNSIAEAVAAVFQGEAGFRLLQGEELVRVGGTPGALKVMVKERIRLGESLSGRVAATGEALIAADVTSDVRLIPEHRAAHEPDRSGALMCVPIRVGGSILGTLHIFREKGYRFDQEALRLAESLADQAGIAIENARLYADAERRRRTAESLAELGRLISQSLNPEEVGQRIVDSLRALLGAFTSALYQLVPESGDLVALAVSGDPGPTFRPNLVFPRGMGVAGLAVRERRPVVTPHLLTDPRVRLTPELQARIEQASFRAVLAVPLVVKDTVIGALGVGDRAGRVFDDEDIRLAQAFADQAALALENARLYAEAERRRWTAESLAELGRLISQSLDPSDVGQRIADSIRGLCTAENSALYRMDPESGDLVALAVSGSVGPTFGQNLVFRRGTGVAGLAVRERRPVATPDLLTDPRITLTPEVRARVEKATYRSVLAVPLVVKDTIVGALGVGDRPGRVFSDEEVRLAQAFADQAALALENARLYAEATRRQREAEELARVARTLTESLDVAAVGERIVESVLPLFGGQAAVLRLLQPDGSLVTIASAGPAREHFAPGHVLASGSGVAGRAVAEGRPVWSRDVLSEPEFTVSEDLARQFAASGVGSALSVPLRVKGKIIGGLTIADRPGRTFTEAEATLLQVFADQAALALENARLFGELREALEQVEASQQRIVQSERLRALGEMAAGVAHDFNNLLAVILGRAEMLLARTRDPDTARTLEAVRTAALDGAQTVRRIQEFTRTRRTRPFGRVELGELLREVVELTRPRWENEAQSRGVGYEVRVEGGPVLPVAGISEELREVFTNLLINALEAMPAGGRFVFRARGEGDIAVVTAEDTGCGMSEETRRRVFEPFFTTKGPRGTGLGLAVVWGIVTRHGGTIEVESTVGAGSRFVIRLPISQDFATEEKTPHVPQPGGGARVLVIDDEAEVREVVRDLLREHGYTVIEAAEGAEGLTRCEREPVNLVLSDVSMPGMSGWEVAAAFRQRFPTVPVGFITGWGDQLDPRQLERHRVRFVLAKPFVANDVLQQVARALNEDAAF